MIPVVTEVKSDVESLAVSQKVLIQIFEHVSGASKSVGPFDLILSDSEEDILVPDSLSVDGSELWVAILTPLVSILLAGYGVACFAETGARIRGKEFALATLARLKLH